MDKVSQCLKVPKVINNQKGLECPGVSAQAKLGACLLKAGQCLP